MDSGMDSGIPRSSKIGLPLVSQWIRGDGCFTKLQDIYKTHLYTVFVQSQWSFLVPLIGSRKHIITQFGNIYLVYKWYILPIGWLYITYLPPIKGTRNSYWKSCYCWVGGYDSIRSWRLTRSRPSEHPQTSEDGVQSNGAVVARI